MMIETKHTPEPWEVRTAGGKSCADEVFIVLPRDRRALLDAYWETRDD